MIVKNFFKDGVKHLLRLLHSSRYRTFCRLVQRYDGKPRFAEQIISFDHKTLKVPDAASLLSMYREIFLNEIYRFESSSDTPLILDFGANIGLSILYFKELLPAAKIFGFEADPYIFSYLQENLRNNHCEDVSVINAAVWNCNQKLYFSADHADGGRINGSGAVEVQAVDAGEILRKYESVDLLKIDIEGAERVVLPALEPHLDRVKRIFVEFHIRHDESPFLAESLVLLERNGFQLFIESIECPVSPFTVPKQVRHFDCQLNVWGRR